MPPNFDDSELQYLFYLTYCCPGETTADLLAQTFNFWFDRDLDADTLRRFLRHYSPKEFEDMAGSEVVRWKHWPIGIWARDSSYSEGSNLRLRSLAMYRMMHDLALLFLGVAFPPNYDSKPKEAIQKFMKPRVFDVTIFQHLSPLDLVRIYRTKERQQKNSLEGMQETLSKLHDKDSDAGVGEKTGQKNKRKTEGMQDLLGSFPRKYPIMAAGEDVKRQKVDREGVQDPLGNLDATECAVDGGEEGKQKVTLEVIPESLNEFDGKGPGLSAAEKNPSLLITKEGKLLY
ncbi:MAG: hypothetical protein Q9169_007370 [Polycauliona sp. 2 TL-2023]